MIGGNTVLRFESSTTSSNTIGEPVLAWSPVGELTGWLDLRSETGHLGYTAYNAPIAESTHVFLADYDATIAAAKCEGCRAIEVIITPDGQRHDGQRYDVQMIDDPMRIHRQLEIYLKHTGGQ